MESVSGAQFNDMFSTKVASADGRESLNALGGDYIRDRLREVSFKKKVVPEKRVTKNDCQVSVNHDTLIMIVEIEPKTRAMVMTFRGQPSAKMISGKRCEAAFFTISSEMYYKTEEELMVYKMPITKIMEENVVKDMDEIQDREWLLHCEAACQAMQKEANGGVVTSLTATAIKGGSVVEFKIRKGEIARTQTTNTATVWPCQRTDLVQGFKLNDGNRLRTEMFLITEVDFDDLLQLTTADQGDKIQSETMVDGYTYNKMLGRRYIRTIKTDILRPGNIYFFVAPQFFAKSYVLNSTRFYIDKVANVIFFQAWENIADVIANVAGIGKIELYSGDATTNDNGGLRSRFVPVDEDALGAVNNRVEQGFVFPKVSSY